MNIRLCHVNNIFEAISFLIIEEGLRNSRMKDPEV